MDREVQVTIVDVSTSQKEIESCEDFKFESRKDVPSYYEIEEQTPTMLPDEEAKLLE
ncbi:hypothetical protein LguiA_005805 [Lonicera macranthoides]